VNIDSTVLDVLSNAEIVGSFLKLTGKLDRPLYVATNKVLEAAGGKWNRKAQAHVFEGDAGEIMEQIILTGKVTNKKQELGFFPTPPAIVARMIEAAEINNGDTILEPSAGDGAILRGIRAMFPLNHLTAVEIDAKRTELSALADTVRYGDFLSYNWPDKFDRVLMNPPFAKQADLLHVNHALTLLKPGGRLVSIMAAGVTFRTNRLTSSFRQFLTDHNGTIEALPENSFAESGTGINTVMVTLDK
jgi:type I restriction-modification system DNA methylase subunit